MELRTATWLRAWGPCFPSKQAGRADAWNSHKAGWEDGLHLCSQHAYGEMGDRGKGRWRQDNYLETLRLARLEYATWQQKAETSSTYYGGQRTDSGKMSSGKYMTSHSYISHAQYIHHTHYRHTHTHHSQISTYHTQIYHIHAHTLHLLYNACIHILVTCLHITYIHTYPLHMHIHITYMNITHTYHKYITHT